MSAVRISPRRSGREAASRMVGGELARRRASRRAAPQPASGGLAPQPSSRDVAPAAASGDLLTVTGLRVSFETEDGPLQAVGGVSFSVAPGEIVAIVGESGSGKSVAALTLMGLTTRAGAHVSGSAIFEGTELIGAGEAQMRRLRGAKIAMVFQDPLSSLNPVSRIGDQIVEQIKAHEDRPRAQALEQAINALARAGLPEPRRCARRYPHELSGGMRQRAMIAMALCCAPRLLIADEPTTALDVTVQAQILAELARLRAESDVAVLLITHDLGVVAGLADKVVVIDAGEVLEQGESERIFRHPSHPRTKRLLASIVRIDDPKPPRAGLGAARRSAAGEPSSAHARFAAPCQATAGGPVLALEHVSVRFGASRSALRRDREPVCAVEDVSLTIAAGETLGLVGESGCGKTTLIRAIARLLVPSAGSIHFDGEDLASASGRSLRTLRRDMQVVFQDPEASLNPRKRVHEALARPLRLRGVSRGGLDAAIASLLEDVGLSAQHASRYPHELSGGQRQRVGIARALALQPSLLLLDEPVSSLDAPVRAQIVALLAGLRERASAAGADLSCLFVAHDLAIVRLVSDRIAVMSKGKIVEIGPAQELCANPRHPVTQALLDAVPRIDAL